jgi:hypothetical protein
VFKHLTPTWAPTQVKSGSSWGRVGAELRLKLRPSWRCLKHPDNCPSGPNKGLVSPLIKVETPPHYNPLLQGTAAPPAKWPHCWFRRLRCSDCAQGVTVYYILYGCFQRIYSSWHLCHYDDMNENVSRISGTSTYYDPEFAMTSRQTLHQAVPKVSPPASTYYKFEGNQNAQRRTKAVNSWGLEISVAKVVGIVGAGVDNMVAFVSWVVDVGATFRGRAEEGMKNLESDWVQIVVAPKVATNHGNECKFGLCRSSRRCGRAR